MSAICQVTQINNIYLLLFGDRGLLCILGLPRTKVLDNLSCSFWWCCFWFLWCYVASVVVHIASQDHHSAGGLNSNLYIDVHVQFYSALWVLTKMHCHASTIAVWSRFTTIPTMSPCVPWATRGGLIVPVVLLLPEFPTNRNTQHGALYPWLHSLSRMH